MEESSSWVVLAKLLRPQGRKGEVLAELLTDFPQRFKHRRVFLAGSGFSGTSTEATSAEVIDSWLPVGKNQGRIVLKFAGTDSITDAERLAGLEVIVPAEERTPLEDEANYISDLIGCALYDSGNPVGVIEDVQFATTPDGLRRLEETAPMLVVASSDGEELLVPYVKSFVVNVDTAGKRVEMRLPAGLLDVNR